MDDNLIFKPIGIIHTPFKEQEGTPIQPAAVAYNHKYHKAGEHHSIPPVKRTEISGHIEIFPEYEAGLKDLEGFERIILIFHLHRICREELIVHPYLDPESTRGVFATRSPCRPNRIGLSCVKLIKVIKNILHIEELDILDGSPLLDIKPYVPQFDCFENVKTGWVGNADVYGRRADNRFK